MFTRIAKYVPCCPNQQYTLMDLKAAGYIVGKKTNTLARKGLCWRWNELFQG